MNVCIVLVQVQPNAELDCFGLTVAVCGEAPLSTKAEARIVGGQDAAAGSWPWQVSLHTRRHFCGGSLINDQWVLTAAQCFPSPDASDVTVYMGRHTQEGPNAHEEARSVMLVIKHPSYDDETKDGDLALLKLSSPVNFTDYIRPVCLAAEESFFPDGLRVWVTGWGDVLSVAYLPSPETLQEVNLPIVSNIECAAAYGFITTSMICAGPNFRGKGFCDKDAGGPLVTLDGTRWVQAGVVSYARGCGYPKFPGVYTRVSKYQSWINSQILKDQPGYITFYRASTRTVHSASSAMLVLPPKVAADLSLK
uniref:Peptidase S1 domain-containing protein n=1 Tax=Fundulus heteroclitus TaxID=8078 RepID=A0A3Q2R2J9_FUNHE